MSIPSDLVPAATVNTAAEPVSSGPYQPSWASLSVYGEAPDWFRDAKSGIWAHWDPQYQLEAGDWDVRDMHSQGTRAYQHHLSLYGHPSEFGFKNVMHAWKADRWEPARLVCL